MVTTLAAGRLACCALVFLGALGMSPRTPRNLSNVRDFLPARPDPAASVAWGAQSDWELSAAEVVGPPSDDAELVVEGFRASHRVRRICRVTAYCDRGLTASGVPSGLGQCAAPADIPFGSLVYIPQLNRTFVVTDRTHERFRHNTVDLFMPERSACLQFGRNYLECEFQIIATPPRYGQLRLAMGAGSPVVVASR